MSIIQRQTIADLWNAAFLVQARDESGRLPHSSVRGNYSAVLRPIDLGITSSVGGRAGAISLCPLVLYSFISWHIRSDGRFTTNLEIIVMNNSTKAQATPIMLAALAVLSSYESLAATHAALGSTPEVSSVLSKEFVRASETIHASIKKMKSMEAAVGKSCKKIVEGLSDHKGRRMLKPQVLAELKRTLEELRSIEIDLIRVPVPSELADLHDELRRATAKARSRVSTFYSLYMQSITVPRVFESSIDIGGLGVLADHMTKKLVAATNA